ncbi:PREDICTED: Polynucleotidyl transferase Ribonuclease H fold [Prunus dulcis]|uniref:PREDICTED: Polynucleotidyl transferase Ribonuclease H fold n=1 Tax=Prunus dulcis TaxID=3755 RepID=A0A5E4EFM3_PRUDU|nr:PREDICTED: Polynucleotidyl transferase Ribonuclease H fold [Prunus dulcis]
MQHGGTLYSDTLDCNVASFVRNGWWDIRKLRAILCEDLVQQDSQIWKPAADGIFTVKSAYELLFAEIGWVDPYWDNLWKLKIPPELKIFAWLIYQGKVPSNNRPVKRHLI